MTGKPAATPLACPLWGRAPMVERVARRGDRAGERFYGCRAYPDCRAIGPLPPVFGVYAALLAVLWTAGPFTCRPDRSPAGDRRLAEVDELDPAVIDDADRMGRWKVPV